MAEHILDVSGLACPLPVLRANKALKALANGDRLTVLTTDPAAPADFVDYCRTANHKLTESRADNRTFTIVITKGG